MFVCPTDTELEGCGNINAHTEVYYMVFSLLHVISPLRKNCVDAKYNLYSKNNYPQKSNWTNLSQTNTKRNLFSKLSIIHNNTFQCFIRLPHLHHTTITIGHNWRPLRLTESWMTWGVPQPYSEPTELNWQGFLIKKPFSSEILYNSQVLDKTIWTSRRKVWKQHIQENVSE